MSLPDGVSVMFVPAVILTSPVSVLNEVTPEADGVGIHDRVPDASDSSI